MTKILFFDTETSGYYFDKLSHEDEKQCYVVQLALSYIDTETGEREKLCELIDNRSINPDYVIAAGAQKVHGISKEKCSAEGINPKLALVKLMTFIKKSDEIIAHNIQFDVKTCLAWAHRTGLYDKMMELLEQTEIICTMEMMRDVVAIPPTENMLKYGITQNKSPTLTECIQFLFNEELDGAHDAMIDVDACERIYMEMWNRFDDLTMTEAV